MSCVRLAHIAHIALCALAGFWEVGAYAQEARKSPPRIAVTESEGGTTVTEGGSTDTFELVLTAQPFTDVVITITSNP